MVMNGMRYPGLQLVLVILLNSRSNIDIYFVVRYQIGAYLIEELSHFIVTAKEVVDYPSFPYLLNIVGFINERIEE